MLQISKRCAQRHETLVGALLKRLILSRTIHYVMVNMWCIDRWLFEESLQSVQKRKKLIFHEEMYIVIIGARRHMELSENYTENTKLLTFCQRQPKVVIF